MKSFKTIFGLIFAVIFFFSLLWACQNKPPDGNLPDLTAEYYFYVQPLPVMVENSTAKIEAPPFLGFSANLRNVGDKVTVTYGNGRDYKTTLALELDKERQKTWLLSGKIDLSWRFEKVKAMEMELSFADNDRLSGMIIFRGKDGMKYFYKCVAFRVNRAPEAKNIPQVSGVYVYGKLYIMLNKFTETGFFSIEQNDGDIRVIFLPKGKTYDGKIIAMGKFYAIYFKYENEEVFLFNSLNLPTADAATADSSGYFNGFVLKKVDKAKIFSGGKIDCQMLTIKGAVKEEKDK